MTRHSTNRIGLVYLNRKSEGSEPVLRFLSSYKALDPGISHDLIVIYKGFANEEERAQAERLFDGLDHRHIDVDDALTDIDSYLATARQFDDIDVFCFVNTFGEITCENWLSMLYEALTSDRVGIAGSTASYESLLNSCRLFSKVIWLCNNNFMRYHKEVHCHYLSVIGQHRPQWIRKHVISRLIAKFRDRADDYAYLSAYDGMFEEFWDLLTRHDGVYEFLKNYPAFPNPHIRSNGFMIRRAHLLPFALGSGRMSKNQSYLFESGCSGLTRQLLDQQLRTVVVNRQGEAFDVDDWPQSRTFRLGSQDGLLITDNQTRNFHSLSSPERDVYAAITWGNFPRANQPPVFTFGIPFKAESRQYAYEGGLS